MVKKEFFNEQDKTFLTIYYADQKPPIRHKEDGPAMILEDEAGNIIMEKWYCNDLLHRIDGPAVVIHRADKYQGHKGEWAFFGEVKRAEEWYLYGKRHRQGGAAIISYDAAGNVLYEKWCYRGMIHREGGPAFVEYQPENKLVSEVWYQWDKIHRIGAPAVIIYLDGVADLKEWYEQGVLKKLD